MAQQTTELKAYRAKFGKEPKMIGMYWREPEALKRKLLESISTGVPYDEYKLLSKEDRAAYDDGDLVF